MFILLPVLIFSQTQWTNFAGNPVMDGAFDPESVTTQRPSVVWDGTRYHMWYTSVHADLVGPVEVMKNYMGYAVSTDGMDWTLVNPAVISPTSDPGTFDQFHAGQGWVVIEQDTFKMWYWGYNIDTDQNTIGMARSADGETWTTVNGPGHLGSVFDLFMAGLYDQGYGLATPCVVKNGDYYYMWYSQILRASNEYTLGCAMSADGVNWIKLMGPGPKGAVLEWGDAGTFDEYGTAWPSVLPTDTGFEMWYYGASASGGRLGYAVSSNGAVWQKTGGGGDLGACFNDAHAVSVIRMNDTYKMWYAVFEDQDLVNYATSGSGTSVEKTDPALPASCILHPNVPNPFNPLTAVRFTIGTRSHVTLTVFDLLGQYAEVIRDQDFDAGTYTVTWDGASRPAGLYLCQLKSGDRIRTIKMSLIK